MARVGIVGAGWAGLAAAVEATSLGNYVTLFEMAPNAGGRARSTPERTQAQLDNGQHILIGGYASTLDLMRRVGVDPASAFLRRPLQLEYPDEHSLRLSSGPVTISLLKAILSWKALRPAERVRLLARFAKWHMSGFKCSDQHTVAELCDGLPQAALDRLLDPLCVAALNTPLASASGQVFLNVLKDALFGPKGSADLLLPQLPLQAMLPDPALAWLERHGATYHPHRRVQRLMPSDSGGWLIDQERFDSIILACTASETARLTSSIAPAWSQCANALKYEPIITIWLRMCGPRWNFPMMAFPSLPQEPAQFGFDLQALVGMPETYAFIISGAAQWVELGKEATLKALSLQLASHFAPHCAEPAMRSSRAHQVIAYRTEKRATFACTPAVKRPRAKIAPGLYAAGDYVNGRYPATLEGAVQSGLSAARMTAAPA